MKIVKIPSSDKAPENQNSIMERLTPAWVEQRKVPEELASTSLTRRLLAAVYMRYSTDKQDPYSFTRQLEKAKAYAEMVGATIVKVYADAGRSGAYTANRPEFNEMLEDAKRHAFNVVIIEEGDRLSRKLHITTTVYSKLAELGIELHSSKLGRWSLMHAAFSGLMSDEQRTRIHELMRSGVVKIVKRGLWPGRIPYGYKKVPGQPGELQIDEEKAPIIRRIFAMRLSGLNDYQIAMVLTQEKVRPPVRRWDAKLIRRILANPIYIGLVLYFKTDQKAVQINETTIVRSRKTRPMSDWISSERSDWAIIEKVEDWQNVQELERKKRECGPHAKYLLSGLVHCAKCGRRLRSRGVNAGRTSLLCTFWKKMDQVYGIPVCNQPRILLDSLEDQVIRFVCEKLDTPAALAEMQAAYDQKANENAELMNRERNRLENERRAIHQRLDATYDATMVAGMTTEVIRDQRANYCARIEEIDSRIAAIPQVTVAKKAFLDAPLDTASFLSELTPMRNYRDCSESLARLMSIFRKLVEKVIVDYDKSKRTVTVNLCGPIAHVAGDNTFTFEHETRVARHIESANKSFQENKYMLTDEDWRKLASRLPLKSLWIEEFDEPADLRAVLNAIIFGKRTKIGIGNSANRFGTKRLIWAAARMLNYAGALDEIEDLMKELEIAQIEGLSLSLEAHKTRRADPWKRLIDWNERRRLRVQARLAGSAKPAADAAE